MLAGYVCLIGAGPGDPGLITGKGLGYLRQADIIVYDHLIPHQLLLEAKKGCRLINVGKEGGKPHIRQEEINRILVREAKTGKFVVRLKGGDPFLMGRGGEEARSLVESGIPYIVVPGVSSSYAVPAYAGIPVTDRRLSRGVTVSPGHTSVEEMGDSFTQVILMGLANLETVVANFFQQGYPETTPVCIISKGSTPFQQVVNGDLASIVTLVKNAGLRTPALMVAGEVVQLHDSLTWLPNLPLFPKRILSTRPYFKNESKDLETLELYGAEVVRFPSIEIRPLPLKNIIGKMVELQRKSWLVLTSVTAVEILCEALVVMDKDWRYFDKSRFAVIGAKTAHTLKIHGRVPDLIATEPNSEGLLNSLCKNVSANETVALCRAKETLPLLDDGLQAAGINYHEFEFYEVVPPTYDLTMAQQILSDPFDVIIFTSPLTVVNFWRIIKDSAITISENTKFACLGKETAHELKKAGYLPWVVPNETSLLGLIKAILEEWGFNENVSEYQVTPVTPN